ncbi:hypothetical protein [Sphingomonas abietis]|uniref:TIGR02611 family protein n=1 Tax=Sphingomonas abietis TaxID=3012344 RepID=A0ABY7NVY0_9SPHN|nr:hypothetical protein [Sphingomonas abietis]WBO23601.1 hypothetical protein PBT88_05595 [Sphingomonas abietis]
MRAPQIAGMASGMTWRERWRRGKRTHGIRHAIFFGGWLLIVAAPIVGLLPGPGGIFLFAAGFALVLQTSPWAKRVYVRAKRRWPRMGALVDRVLRRGSAQRRRERDKLALAGASARAAPGALHGPAGSPRS